MSPGPTLERSTSEYASPSQGAVVTPQPAVLKSQQKTMAARSPNSEVGPTLTGASSEAAALAAVAVEAPLERGQTSPSLTNAMLGQELGSYRVLDILGEGGMGRVYLVEHMKIGRRVALKMLHSHLAQSPEVVRRFFDEARAVNRILHEHIVEITDFVENEEGNNYFIMEHLKGAPLSDEMEAKDGSSQISRSLGIGVQVASALSAVHAANIVHRDLKPENVFLTQRGGQKDFVKLLDFGIAKLVGDDGGGMKLQTTQAGVIMGTPDYMSPEQASAGAIDHRTDIYSLGVILYELCTGVLPFVADNFGDLIVMHKTKKPLKPSKVPDVPHKIPAPLEELILKCLEKEPEKRPQSAKEVEDTLNEIAWGFAVELEHFELTGVDGQRSNRRGMFLGAAGVAIAAAALGFALTRGGDEGTNAAPEPTPVAEAPAIVAQPKKEVALSFLSVPEGAMVYTMGADAELLGVTPFTASFPRSAESLKFEFRKDGYLSKALEATPEKRGSVRAELEAEPVKPLTAAEKKAEAKLRRAEKRAAAAAARAKARAAGKGKGSGKGKGKGFKEGAVMDPFANK